GRPLGSGSGGAVSLYRRKTDGVPVAVKRFAPARVGESLQHRANKVDAEIQLLCMLSHPNIMNVLDRASDYTVKLLVTECYAGDLFSAVERNLSSMEMRELFCQLLRAVAYMHSRGVAHRDLKLENICIDRDDQIKIIDLGNAIRVAPTTAATQESLCFGVYGSDPYAAYADAGYNPFKADLWALGILLVAMTHKSFVW
ncbi:kinase-like domain-containing protein, partial [Syncephalis pseudoplumigaleata]